MFFSSATSRFRLLVATAFLSILAMAFFATHFLDAKRARNEEAAAAATLSKLHIEGVKSAQAETRARIGGEAEPNRAAALPVYDPQAEFAHTALKTIKVKTIAIRPIEEASESLDSRAAEQQATRMRLELAGAKAPQDAGMDPARAVVAAQPPVQAAAVDSIVTGSIRTEAPAAALARLPAPPVAANGAFSVQLAAAPSEDEARNVAQTLQSQFPDDLGRRGLVVLLATVKDRTVYRVRVAELSREQANELCGKLRSQRAACFVARD